MTGRERRTAGRALPGARRIALQAWPSLLHPRSSSIVAADEFLPRPFASFARQPRIRRQSSRSRFCGADRPCTWDVPMATLVGMLAQCSVTLAHPSAQVAAVVAAPSHPWSVGLDGGRPRAACKSGRPGRAAANLQTRSTDAGSAAIGDPHRPRHAASELGGGRWTSTFPGWRARSMCSRRRRNPPGSP